MDGLPESLRYGVSSMPVRMNRVKIVPIGTDTFNSGSGIMRFRLPERSLVRLNSASLTATANITGMDTTAGNWANALFPSSYKYFRSVKFYVNGLLVSGGQSNHYNQIYSALGRATLGEDYCKANLLQNFVSELTQSDVVASSLQVAPSATTKSAFIVADNFLGLPRGNGSGDCVIDTSLFGGSLEIELIADDASILQVANAGNGVSTGIDWNLTNCRFEVDVLTQVPSLYAQLLSVRIQNPEPIKFAFQNFISQIQLNNSSNRLQVNTGCMDMLMALPLNSNYTTRENLTSNVLQQNKFRFNSGFTTSTQATGRLQVQVGSVMYPQQPIDNMLLVADYTQNAFHHGSILATNLLWHGITAGTEVYNYTAFLAENFVYTMPFSLQEGWASKILSGVDTASQSTDIIISSQNFPANSYLLLVALTTSVLSYDTQTGAVSVAY